MQDWKYALGHTGGAAERFMADYGAELASQRLKAALAAPPTNRAAWALIGRRQGAGLGGPAPAGVRCPRAR